MVDPAATTRAAHRLLYAALAFAFLFVRLMPLSTIPVRIPGPDLILCLTIVWLLRRPDYVPAALIAAVFLVNDIFTMRAPGLWPLIVLFGTEFLRSREVSLRDLPFALEWLIAGGVIIAMTVLERLVLALFLVPTGPSGMTVLQSASTILAYPLVALVSHYLLGLRRGAPGQQDALGRRL